MSGHSKWNNIKRTKEKSDAQKGKIFTKIGREIAVIVKQGGSDASSNPRLKDIIAKARQNNMPSDTIERSIKKAAGELGSINYEDIAYEGYGVGGAAVIVECLTDNKNRTAGDVRHLFDKYGGSLGSNGCVSYLFNRKGIILIAKTISTNVDDVMLDALDCGALDVVDDDDVIEIVTSVEEFNVVKSKLEDKNYVLESGEITLVADINVDLEDKNYETFEKMIEKLEELDDVQEVYHNVNAKSV